MKVNMRYICENGECQIVEGKGSKSPLLMFVAKSPNYECVQLGKPVAGRERKLLCQLLDKAGIDHKDVYFTNIIKCANEEYTEENVKKWWYAFWSELQLQPQNLICLGLPVFSLLTRELELKDSLENFFGKSYQINTVQSKIYVSYDLSSLMKRGKESHEKVVELLRGMVQKDTNSF